MKVTTKHIVPILILSVLPGIMGCIHSTLDPITEVWVDENANFSLYVSNQSFSIDPVDIQVEINGRLVVSQQFRVKTQHTYVRFRIFLDEGMHKVRIWSTKGDAELSSEFIMNGDDVAVITYWYKPEITERSFQFKTLTGPLGIL